MRAQASGVGRRRLIRPPRFASLPVALLQAIEVVPPAMTVRDRARPYETFERWGIRTLGALAALPAADLSSRLGRRGQALQRLARGLDPRPFVPDGDTPRFLERLELEWPIDGLEPLSFILARLLDPLSSALERADRGAAAVHLDLRLTDRVDARARAAVAGRRCATPRVLRTLMLLDLESHPPAAAIDIVTIELDPAPARITQFSLLERALPSPETLSTLTARLSALVGETRCGAAVLVDTISRARSRCGVSRLTTRRACGIPGASARGSRRPAPATAIHPRSVCGRRPVVRGMSPPRVAVCPVDAVVQSAGPWRSIGRMVEGGRRAETAMEPR